MSRERFKQLAEQALPLQRDLDKIRLEMVHLSHEMSQSIVTEAFPEATVQHVNVVSEIKPSDWARSAEQAVALLQENGYEPNLIIVDHNLHRVLLCTAAVLPPAAKPRKHPQRK